MTTQQVIEHLLNTIPLFSVLPGEEINHLATILQTVSMPEKSVLLEEGSIDNQFFILVDGWVEIVKSMGTEAQRVVGWRQHGTLLGEMSMYTSDGAHTASVIAMTPVKLLTMSKQDFNALLERHPRLAFEMVRILSQRLVESENLTILDLEEKNRMLVRAYEELKRAQIQVIEKEKLEHELEISRRIQRSILPQNLPVSRNVDYGAMMQPARAVGGDFYDFIQLPGGKMGIVIGDVSDKGVPAALFMAVSYSLVRAESQRYASPDQVLTQVNRHLLDINVADMFVTLVYGILDEETGNFEYARAGHPVPLVLDAGCQPIDLPRGLGQPMGMLRKPEFDVQQVILPAGGVIVFYSDGLSEAINVEESLFGSERIYRALTHCKAASAQQICAYLWDQVQSFSGDQPQQDDFTVIAIRRTVPR